MLQPRRLFSFILMLVVLGLTLSEANPALAASSTFHVGSSTKCGKNLYPDLQSAVDAAKALSATARKTIIVCPGTYTIDATVTVDSINNLTVTGRKGAILTTPDSSTVMVFQIMTSDNVTVKNLTFKAGPNFNGQVVSAVMSTRIKVQKLVIDGQGSTGGPALGLIQTSGSVLNNKVLNWHNADYTSSGAFVLAAGSLTENVRITGNTVNDYAGLGIMAIGLNSLTVTGNKFTGTTVTSGGPVAQVGVLAALLSSGRISGNRITGGAFPAITSGGMATGIVLQYSKNVRVTGNRIAHWDTGIELSNGCNSDPNTNHVVTGNRISEVMQGIMLESLAQDGCNGVLNNVTVKGNTIKDTAAQGIIGIAIGTTNYPDPDPVYFGQVLNATVRGNTIANFQIPMNLPLPNPPNVTGVFKPNRIR